MQRAYLPKKAGCNLWQGASLITPGEDDAAPHISCLIQARINANQGSLGPELAAVNQAAAEL